MQEPKTISFRWTAFLVGLAMLGLSSCEDLLTELDTGDPRENLVDTWKCDEQNAYYKSAREVYYVEISKHPNDTSRVLIYNFFNVDADAEAILQGKTLILPQQILEGGYQVSGTGEISGNWKEILWTYQVDDGSGIPNEVSAVYTKYAL